MVAYLVAPRPWTGRSPVVMTIALATFGSGVLNLYSLMRPTLSGRLRLLYGVFPVEFITLSRFVVLVAGFALIISSLNIYRRKLRAYRAVAFLAAASAAFHLAKGIDLFEASLSLVLLVLLIAERHLFTVRSGQLDVRSAAARLGTTVLTGVVYGVAAFLLLDPREFGIAFSLREAVHQTIACLTFSGDPRLVPHTRHAAWFLDSLSVMTGMMVAYSATLIYRPVRYRLHTLPHERAAAQTIVRDYGRCPLDFFKTWPDKSYFFSSSRRSFLAYSVAGSFALVLADPVGPEEDIETTVAEFSRYCTENGWSLAFYQALPDFLPIYARCGFSRLKLGDDAIVDLSKFTLDGKDRRSLRIAVHKIERQGVSVRRYDPPLADDLLAALEEISNDWLRIPGRRERQFSLGRFDTEYVRRCPAMIATTPDGVMQAFVNVIPSPRKGETTVDLMRRRGEAPNGLMEFLLVKVLADSRERGFERFSLGLAPMSGFHAGENASPEERAIHFFFQHLRFVFSYAGLRAYKAKFATHWEPRYVIYRNDLDLPRMALTLARVSEIRS